MIEAEKSFVIGAPIDSVWDYVRDIGKWASLLPGCRECAIIDEHNSRWTIKVGAGGLVKTVNVLVCVEKWDGPERVNFTYKLESEPVVGGGCYIASKTGSHATDVRLQLRVEGSGPMAPMWEAVCKPLFNPLAGAFTEKLKTEIEQYVGVPALPAAEKSGSGSVMAVVMNWLRKLWLTVAGGNQSQGTQSQGSQSKSLQSQDLPANKDKVMSEQNKQVVLKFINAMGSSDGATAATCLAQDAFTLAKGFGKFAGIRRYDTIVGTIDAFKQLVPTGLRPDIKSVTAESDRVVVEFEGNATTCDGKPYNNQYCMVFTLADGKIKQVNEYFCTILAEDVLWPLIEKMADAIPQS